MLAFLASFHSLVLTQSLRPPLSLSIPISQSSIHTKYIRICTIFNHHRHPTSRSHLGIDAASIYRPISASSSTHTTLPSPRSDLKHRPKHGSYPRSRWH
ncbi:hypothetical protein B0T13DRAFT_117893 [Neurospora crassa]|nr:hypothetical protein B0T13DRAFT_117893 [Neurospora crassa]